MKLLLLALCAVTAFSADVSHLPPNQYLPPQHYAAASNAAPVFQSAPSFQFGDVDSDAQGAASVSFGAAPAASEAAISFAAPAQTFRAAPAPTYHAATSAPVVNFAAPASTFHAAPAPATVYHAAASAPAVSADSEPSPAHAFSATDGYHFRTSRRVVYREMPSNDYLPPTYPDSAPAVHYAPASIHYDSAPSYESPSNEFNASEAAPTHSLLPCERYRSLSNRRHLIVRRRRIMRRKY